MIKTFIQQFSMLFMLAKIRSQTLNYSAQWKSLLDPNSYCLYYNQIAESCVKCQTGIVC